MTRSRIAASAVAALTLLTGGMSPAAAEPADPAAARVEDLCNGLLEAVKLSKGGGLPARAHRMQPVVDQHFNLDVMAQFAVGPAWANMTPTEHKSLEAALSRYTGARIAQEFDAYTGQRCIVDPAAQTRGPDKVVKSQIVDKSENSAVNYRLREYGGAWKVIDIYYNGVSQLATQRADFASVLQSGGASGLTAKLNELAAKMR